jgi:hypothetical protein
VTSEFPEYVFCDAAAIQQPPEPALQITPSAASVELLWCCCNQTASKARNKQPDTLFEAHPKQQNTT